MATEDAAYMATRRLRIAFVTRSLNMGGAERQLAMLAIGLNRLGMDVIVLVLYPVGPLYPDLLAAGVKVVDLSKRSRWDLAGPFLRLMAWSRRERPELIHGYMESGNLLALAGRMVSRRSRVVWGVRASRLDLSQYDRLTRALSWLGRHLSARADLIIANSEAGRRDYVEMGYPSDKMMVIPNGIDTRSFRPEPPVGAERRRRWLEDMAGERLVALVARLDPMKDHRTFLEAARKVVALRPMTRFICVGNGSPSRRRELQTLTAGLGIAEAVAWEGRVGNMTSFYNAIDVLCLSSAFGEGFPNVVAEALACGVPCVVTDVGDAAMLVGTAGVVVPPRDPRALADGIVTVLDDQARNPNGVSDRARARVVPNYEVGRLVARTAEVLMDLAC